MRSVIKADTDLMRATGRQMQQISQEIMTSLNALTGEWNELMATWSGMAAQDAHAAMQQWHPHIPQAAVALDKLGAELQRLAARLEHADGLDFLLDLLHDALDLAGLVPIAGMPFSLLNASIYAAEGDWSSAGQALRPTPFGLLNPNNLQRLQQGIGWIEDATGKGAAITDRFMDETLSSIVPKPERDDETQTVRFALKSGIQIPGAELGIPGSLKGVEARSVALTRASDGTYLLTLTNEVGGGLVEDLNPNSARIRTGNEERGIGVNASAEVLAKGTVETTYRFNPQTRGDLSKMGMFLVALGISPKLPGIGMPAVGPSLLALKDNLQSVKGQAAIEGQASANFTPLVKLVGVEGKESIGAGGMLSKNQQGQWELSQNVEFEGGLKGQWRDDRLGASSKLTLEHVSNLDNGASQAKVTLEVTAEQGKGLTLQDIEGVDLLPKNLDKVDFQKTDYNKFTIEYTLDEPVDSVKQMLSSGDGFPDLQPIAERSSIDIKGTTGSETGFGGGVKLGVPTQAVGLDVDGTLAREREVQVFSLKRMVTE